MFNNSNRGITKILIVGIIAVLVVICSSLIFTYQYFSKQQIKNQQASNLQQNSHQPSTSSQTSNTEFQTTTSQEGAFPPTSTESQITLSPEEISQRKKECQDIPSKEGKMVCYAKLAIDTNDPNFCQEIDTYYVDQCLNWETAVKTNNSELCKKLELSYRKIECQNMIAIKLNDPSKCASDDCVMKISVNQKDISICESKFNKAFCFVQFPKLLQASLTGKKYSDNCYVQPGGEWGVEACGYYEVKNQYLYPNAYDDGNNDYPEQIAPKSAFVHLLSVPFNNSNNLLRVYTDVRVFTDPNLNYTCKYMGMLRLVKYSPSKKTSELLGDVVAKIGVSSGGIYIPIGISKDDDHIIFKAHMASPAMGGGSVDYGYAYLSLQHPQFDKCGYLDPKRIEEKVYFYDNFSKALFLTEERNVPPSERPGPYYPSVIKFINIITSEIKTLFKEPNTIYEIINIDEKTGRANFKSCPWKEYEFDCSTSSPSTQIRSLQLP